MIDFALFRNRQFASGVAAAIVASIVLIGCELALSQRLQLVLGLSPLMAGMLILPAPLAAFVAGPLTGLVLPRIGAERLLPVAFLIAGLGLACYLATPDGAIVLQSVTPAMLGAGLGAAMTVASNAIMVSAPEERAGMAASVEEVSYELGGAIGIAVLGSIMSAVYTAAFALPPSLTAPGTVADSIDEALVAAQDLAPSAADLLIETARSAFDQAFVAVLATAIAILLVTATTLALTGRTRVAASA